MPEPGFSPSLKIDEEIGRIDPNFSEWRISRFTKDGKIEPRGAQLGNVEPHSKSLKRADIPRLVAEQEQLSAID
jgi:hypothetical protein